MKIISVYNCQFCGAEVLGKGTSTLTHEHIVEQLVSEAPGLYYSGHSDETYNRELFHYCDSDHKQIGLCKLIGMRAIL